MFCVSVQLSSFMQLSSMGPSVTYYNHNKICTMSVTAIPNFCVLKCNEADRRALYFHVLL